MIVPVLFLHFVSLFLLFVFVLFSGIGGIVYHYFLTGKSPLRFLAGIPNYKSCVSHPDSLFPNLIKTVGPVLPKIC
jgi:hypothetical protein